MILEKSVQAQFLIPMAVGQEFGSLFATIILVGVPAGMESLDLVHGVLARESPERSRRGVREGKPLAIPVIRVDSAPA